MDEELVFKALADESRRTLLDALFQADGQTLKALVAHLNAQLGDDKAMTRYGVMKHLSVLEDANLISTRKIGRAKYHYLNPVPIQLVYDRWVSKFAQPWTQGLAALKHQLEETNMNDKPANIFQIFIRTTPEKLWEALTNGDFTQQYYMGTRVESTWEKGAEYSYNYGNGEAMITGTVLEAEPPTHLVTTFNPMWMPSDRQLAESRVTYTIVQRGESCLLTIVHDQLPTEPPLMPEGIKEGWAQILSGLKTLLETGETLSVSLPEA